jgi:type VI secretion system protein ImpF
MIGSRTPASILDRLLDPRQSFDQTTSAAADAVSALRVALRRGTEALLNSREPWRSIPARFVSLRTPTLSYGLIDFAGGILSEPHEKERPRSEIGTAITRFEPRLTAVNIEHIAGPSPLEAVLACSISAVLQIDLVPEPITFDTTVDTTTSDIGLRGGEWGLTP